MTNHPNRSQLQQAAEKRLEAALDPAKRDLFDKMDVLLAAAVQKDKRLTPWEMQFLSSVMQRYARYYTDIQLSDKQIATIEKIHEKVKDVFAI